MNARSKETQLDIERLWYDPNHCKEIANNKLTSLNVEQKETHDFVMSQPTGDLSILV